MRYARKRDEEARAIWLEGLKQLDIEKVYFLDETHAYLNMSRDYGRAHTSKRVIDHEPKGEKIRSSLIAAVSSKGFNPQHSFIDPEGINKASFLTYLDKVLLPSIPKGSTLVLDNWTVHHGQDIRDLVASYHCQLFYLPAYSPDLNPIEYLFSKIKAFIRGLRPLSLPDLRQAFVDAVHSITNKNVSKTFRHCKYV